MSFWYAKSDIKDARIVLLGVPLDETTTGIPGTRLGPDRIRASSENVESYSPYFKKNLNDFAIADAGNLEFDYLPSIETKLALISQKLVTYNSSGIKPLLVGGEHTITLAAVQAMIRKYPDLCLLQLDAHADLRDVGESGSRIAHDTVMRRVMELIEPDSLFQIGLRSFAEEEIKLLKSHSKDTQKLPKSYPKNDYDLGSPRVCEANSWGEKSYPKLATGGRMRRISDLKSHTFGEDLLMEEKSRPVWLSLDLDVLDPSIMPAVGTPEPGGMSYAELLDLLVGLEGSNIVGADIVEFNPLAADFPAPAIVAANLVREIILLLAS